MPSGDITFKRLMRRMRSDAARLAEAKSLDDPIGDSRNGMAIRQSIIPNETMGDMKPPTPQGAPLPKGPTFPNRNMDYPTKAKRQAKVLDRTWEREFLKGTGLSENEVEEAMDATG